MIQLDEHIFPMSSAQNPGWLGYNREFTTQLHRDYFISYYKDPY